MWREWSSSQWSWGLAPAFTPTGAGDLLEAGAKPEASLSAEHSHSVSCLVRSPGGAWVSSTVCLHLHGFPAAGIRRVTTGQGRARMCWGRGRRNTAQSLRHFLAGQGFFHSLLLAWIQEAPRRRHRGCSVPAEAAAVLILAYAQGTRAFCPGVGG